MNTLHADKQKQRRCIPPLIEMWLEEYGQELHDGHGGIIKYFSNKSKRKMERELGHHIVRYISKWLNVYMVIGFDNGKIITLGWRSSRIFHYN
jgi:hypothetical protein